METLLELHQHSYMEHAKACFHVLEEAWATLDLSMEERRAELQITMDAASSAWGAAMARADQRRLLVLSEMKSMQRETSRIAEQLGAQHCQVSKEHTPTSLKPSEHQALQAPVLGGLPGRRCGGSALMQRHRAAELELGRWRNRKVQRVQQQEELQVQSFPSVCPD